MEELFSFNRIALYHCTKGHADLLMDERHVLLIELGVNIYGVFS